jgi:hypothetical protein
MEMKSYREKGKKKRRSYHWRSVYTILVSAHLESQRSQNGRRTEMRVGKIEKEIGKQRGNEEEGEKKKGKTKEKKESE